MDFDIYGDYFSHAPTVASIIVPLASLLFLYLFFRRNRDPRARSWSLGLMMLSSIFLWLFLGLSLALCSAFSAGYELHEEATLTAVFGRALLFALTAGVPLTILLRSLSPRVVLGKVKNLSLPSAEIRKPFAVLRRRMGVPNAALRLCKIDVPISFALDAKKPLVIVSENLLSLLKRDELEAVMAHELAHIKNSDTVLKAFVTAYRAALPHDPIIRLVEAAFHREREMVADETAVNITGKPLSLASALLKIYEAFPKNNLRAYGTFSILGSGSSLMKRHPPIINRVNRLIYRAQT
jgi:Zn-dependent protease with chaperone function